MNWRPSAGRDALELRAALLGRLRAFFVARGVLEVETPIAAQAASTDPNIASVSAALAGRRVYLQTSPEFAMKRLLAAGSGDIYQVCKVFRDGECGRHHNPEFTMLEWYRLGFDHHRLMQEVLELLGDLLGPARVGAGRRVSFRDVVSEGLGLDPFTASAARCRRALEEAGIAIPDGLAGDRDALMDLAMGSVVGPTLGRDGLCFVYDYPASRAALARIRDDDPPVAERFEVYLDGIELANGFHELRDAGEQRRRFEAELDMRSAAGQPLVPADERLLAALDHGLPACAGVAVGLDRVIMLAARSESLAGVLSFDFEQI